MSTGPVDTTDRADLDADHRADPGTSTTDGGRAAMSRFRFDPMALIAGLVFTGIAVAYILRAAGAVSVSAPWSLAVAAIGLGLAGLAGALWATVTRAVARGEFESKGRGGEAAYSGDDVTPPRPTAGAARERTPEPPVNPDK